MARSRCMGKFGEEEPSQPSEWVGRGGGRIDTSLKRKQRANGFPTRVWCLCVLCRVCVLVCACLAQRCTALHSTALHSCRGTSNTPDNISSSKAAKTNPAGSPSGTARHRKAPGGQKAQGRREARRARTNERTKRTTNTKTTQARDQEEDG